METILVLLLAIVFIFVVVIVLLLCAAAVSFVAKRLLNYYKLDTDCLEDSCETCQFPECNDRDKKIHLGNRSD